MERVAPVVERSRPLPLVRSTRVAFRRKFRGPRVTLLRECGSRNGFTGSQTPSISSRLQFACDIIDSRGLPPLLATVILIFCPSIFDINRGLWRNNWLKIEAKNVFEYICHMRRGWEKYISILLVHFCTNFYTIRNLAYLNVIICILWNHISQYVYIKWIKCLKTGLLKTNIMIK